MHSMHHGLASVRVFSNIGGSHAEIIPDEKGYLGEKFSPGSELILFIKLDRSKVDHVVPVTTNRTKSVAVELRETMKEGELVYHHTVPITDEGYVNNNDNLVRLVVMSNKGEVVSKNVAIIVQRGSFYLAPAETYRAKVYRDVNRMAVCPDLVDKGDGKGSFIGILPFIEEHYDTRFHLAPVASYRPSPKQSPELIAALGKLEGDNDMIVVSWSLASGIGVAIRKDGTPIKVYWAKVNVADRTPVYLFEGEVITARGFSRLHPSKSKLPFEAEGVTRLEEVVAVSS